MKKIKKGWIGVISMLLLVAMLPNRAAAISVIVQESGSAIPEELCVGEEIDLDVKGVTVTFSVSDEGKATITPDGELTALAPGLIKVTARRRSTDQVIATASITILKRCESVIPEPKEIVLHVGEAITIQTSLLPGDSTDVLRFYSDDKTIATVGVSSGRVAAQAPGATIITIYAKQNKNVATSDEANVKTTVNVTVLPAEDDGTASVLSVGNLAIVIGCAALFAGGIVFLTIRRKHRS